MATNYADLAKKFGGAPVSGGIKPAAGAPAVANYADIAKQLGGQSLAVAPPTATPEPPKSLVQNTAGFLGIEKFGQGIASTIRNATGEVGQDINTQNQNSDNIAKLIAAARSQPDPTKKKRLLDMAKNLGGNVPTAEQIDPGLNLSNREILGSAANVGLNIFAGGELSGGVRAGGLTRQLAPELATSLNRGAKVLKGVTEGGGLTGSVVRNATLGGGFGLAGGLNQNLSGQDLLKSTGGGALLGGALSLAGAAISKAKNLVTQTLPEKLYNSAVKPTLSELRKNVKFGQDTLGRDLLNEGVYGSPSKLLQTAQSKLTSTEDELQKILTGSRATITKQEIAPFLDKIKAQAKNTPGMKAEVSKITKVFNDLPAEFSVAKANTIKRDLYKTLNDAGYKLDASLTVKRDAQKAIARGLKDLIEKKTKPTYGDLVPTLNKKLAIYGRLQDRTVDILAKEAKSHGLSTLDLIIGSGFGTGLNPVGLGTVFAKHLYESPTTSTTVAHGLNQLGKKLPQVPAALGRLGKQAILNAP